VNSLWVRLPNVVTGAIASADITEVRVRTMVAFRTGSTECGIQAVSATTGRYESLWRDESAMD
jgi:hypothetical protein